MARLKLVGLALVLAGCASARSSLEAPLMSEPLASFASLRMVILPVQLLRGGDSLGWGIRAGDARRYLASVDSVLEKEFRDRGLATVWAFPTDLARTARRNPVYATDPAAIRAGDAARYMERRRDPQIPEPVASQLRALVGFHDARHALVPVELRFDKDPSGSGGRAILHVVIMDVRGSRLAWVGDIASEFVPELSPALVAGLARRFADLVVAR